MAELNCPACKKKLKKTDTVCPECKYDTSYYIRRMLTEKETVEKGLNTDLKGVLMCLLAMASGAANSAFYYYDCPNHVGPALLILLMFAGIAYAFEREHMLFWYFCDFALLLCLCFDDDLYLLSVIVVIVFVILRMLVFNQYFKAPEGVKYDKNSRFVKKQIILKYASRVMLILCLGISVKCIWNFKQAEDRYWANWMALQRYSYTPSYTTSSSTKTNRKECNESGCHNEATSDRGYCKSHTCTYSGCDAHRTEGSTLCWTHATGWTPSKSSGSKTKNRDSYDAGYEDVWLNGDYDDDRYRRDWDYALGVDDALDEFD